MGEYKSTLMGVTGMADKLCEILAANMRIHREAFGYSQMKLAELAGLSTSYIAAMETCSKFPSSKSLIKLADAFGLQPYQLLIEPVKNIDDPVKLGVLKEDLKEEIAEQIESYFRRYFNQR